MVLASEGLEVILGDFEDEGRPTGRIASITLTSRTDTETISNKEKPSRHGYKSS